MLNSYVPKNLVSDNKLTSKTNDQLFHSLFDFSLEFIGLLSPTGVVLEANKTSLDFIGAELNDVKGRYIWNTPWWQQSQEFKKNLKNAIKRGNQGKITHFETQHHGLNNQTISVEIFLKPLMTTSGKTAYLLVEGHNITSFKKTDQLKKELLSSVAHELKTPITVLKLLSQLYQGRINTNGHIELSSEDLLTIDQELDRLTGLINDLLDLSRIDTGKFRFTFTEINIKQLLQDTIKKISLYARNHQLSIKNLPNVSMVGDLNRLQQVFINLITNAVKYSPEGKIISIDSYIDNGKVIIQVQDQGIGIAKRFQTLIFNKFFQVIQKQNKGFGLGLYISKEILKRHHGKIWVESNVGEGSTFFISLPIISLSNQPENLKN